MDSHEVVWSGVNWHRVVLTGMDWHGVAKVGMASHGLIYITYVPENGLTWDVLE